MRHCCRTRLPAFLTASCYYNLNAYPQTRIDSTVTVNVQVRKIPALLPTLSTLVPLAVPSPGSPRTKIRVFMLSPLHAHSHLASHSPTIACIPALWLPPVFHPAHFHPNPFLHFCHASGNGCHEVADCAMGFGQTPGAGKASVHIWLLPQQAPGVHHTNCVQVCVVPLFPSK